ETAQHASMPRSAIASGCVDLVLPPHEIAREIVRIAGHPYVKTEPAAAPSDEETLARIVQVLHRQTGVDFSQYKANTLYRRITRRVVLHRFPGLPEYLR